MATGLTIDALRATLRESETIQQNPFGILKAIAALVNNEATVETGREMVLRALDQRSAFGSFAAMLDSFVHTVGLYPYIAQPELLGLRETLTYEFNRPLNLPNEIVFHREQAEVYRRLLAGDNVILSAPTSFGKSKIIDAIIASERYSNLVIVVPTLALIDETRRRLSVFSDRYKIVTHVSQRPAARNVFVLTAERAVAYPDLPKIDFFVIDEFYKIGSGESDETRKVALNQAFYRLRKQKAQFYLLGPKIDHIPDGMEAAYRCFFYLTNYATVVAEQERIETTGDDDLARLIELARALDEPTLIFCSSPPKVNALARAFIDAGLGFDATSMQPCADWSSTNYHPDWIFGKALSCGIGIHHGKLPRSLSQFVVRAFNDDKIRFLICTSTLIEGVNTKAKNVVIYDNKIARKQIDYFTFNNIKGRSGRMFEHFIGHVYLFNDEPQMTLPFVDFPVFTQPSDTPESLLIQLDDPDLTDESRERLKRYAEEEELPIEVIRENNSIEPADQVALARAIRGTAQRAWPALAWDRFPRYKQLRFVCDLIWKHFVHEGRRGGITSGSQLTLKTWQLIETTSISRRVANELTATPPYNAESADEAVERVLEFDRTWASFDLPRFLNAISNIQAHVLKSESLPFGDYRLFASKLECLFRTPVVAALDEYGIPLQVAEKLQPSLKTPDNLDEALANLKRLDLAKMRLTPFEREIVRDAQRDI